MVNVAGALDTLGKGLGAFAIRRDEREQKELENLRREALAKLQMQHETDLATQQQKHQTDLFERGQEADTERQGREIAFRAGERAASDEAADRRLGRQLSATRDAELRRGREDIRQNYTRLIASTDSQLKAMQIELGKLGEAADPTQKAFFTQQIEALNRQRDDYQRSMVYDLQRVDAGGYGAGLTEDQVRAMRDSGGTTAVGAKGPRNDDLFGPSVGGMSGAKSMTAQALGIQPMDSLQGQGPQSAPAAQGPQAPAPFPSMPSSQPFQASPSVAGAVGGASQDLFAPTGGPTMQPAGPQAPTPQASPQALLPGGAGPMQMDPTVSSVMNTAQPPPEIPPAQMPALPPNATPIQRHRAMTLATAARALQLVRARMPLDQETKGAAKRVGSIELSKSGWTPEDLAAIGL